MLVSKEFTGYSSYLVLFELFGVLSRINVEAAYVAVSSIIDMPLIMLEVNRDTFNYARDIAVLSGTTHDSLHAALVAQNNIDTVVTEDISNWGRILRIWPRLKEKYDIGDLTVISPTKGVIKPD